MKTSEQVVFLPGLLDDREMWAEQLRHLADDADVFAIDLLTQESVERGAELVLDTVVGDFALVGFSMGGYVGFEIMRRASRRVTRLALVDTSARGDTYERRDARLDQIAMAESGRYEELVDAALPEVVHPSRRGDAQLMGTLRTMALRVGAEAYVRQQKTCMSRPDSRGNLAAIKCTTLVVCGREDVITPPALSQEIGRLTGAPMVLVDDCNHYTPMERPHALSALLRWWLQIT